jgi:hypothetical protein
MMKINIIITTIAAIQINALLRVFEAMGGATIGVVAGEGDATGGVCADVVGVIEGVDS